MQDDTHSPPGNYTEVAAKATAAAADCHAWGADF